MSGVTIEIPWEDDLKPGPVGEYVEVIDVVKRRYVTRYCSSYAVGASAVGAWSATFGSSGVWCIIRCPAQRDH
jgi:hypothetical protein